VFFFQMVIREEHFKRVRRRFLLFPLFFSLLLFFLYSHVEYRIQSTLYFFIFFFSSSFFSSSSNHQLFAYGMAI
jgi:hypothetical protein